MKGNTSIPKYLDEPERLLFWTIDEFIALIVPIVFGFAIGVFWLGLVLSPLSSGLLMKTKKRRSPGAFLSRCYWYLPSSLVPLKAVPLSHQRVWVG